MMSQSQNNLESAFSSGLTASQQKAVFHREGPLLVIAGPGSGKTRVITCRIAALINSGVAPHNICAITFTNKAADEMRQRAVALGASGGAHISTFHSLCVRILRRYAPAEVARPNFSIYDDSDQTKCMKQAITDCNLSTTDFSPARTLAAVSTLKNKLIDSVSFEKQADDFFSKTLAKIYTRYQKILNDHNAFDFDDLLLRAALLLENHPDVCSQLSERYRFLLIDEYQDTNHAQYRIARALVSSHNNICATGDPDQSIYRWRGADIRNILDFERDWPDAIVVRLEENFRSTPVILDAADRLIANNISRKEKRLLATRAPAGNVFIEPFEDETAEAFGLAATINRMVDEGVSLSDIGIFYRVNSQSRALEEALIKNQIPYQIVRGVEFYNRKEIRDIIAYLKVIANPADEVALLRIINTPTRGIGKTTIDRIRDYARRTNQTLYEALKKADAVESLSKSAKTKVRVFIKMLDAFQKDVAGPVAPLAESVFTESGLEQSLISDGAEGKDALENIGELISAAALYDQQAEEPTLVDYLQQIALFSDVDIYDATSERVALMTLHSAKGLEFDTVFIVGVEEGLLPHERSAEDDDETEEERRLLFVGITRAKTNLHISFTKYRQIRGQLLRAIPSQFLFELGIEVNELAYSQNLAEEPEVEELHAQLEKPSRNRKVPKSDSQFRPGDLVVHKKFGLGTVKEFADMGDNSVVVVAFNTGHVKSLLTKYARLAKI